MRTLALPKSWLIAAAAGTFLSAEGGSAAVQAAFLGGLFVLAALPSCFLWLAFGDAIPRVLHSRRRLRIFNIIMAPCLPCRSSVSSSRAGRTDPSLPMTRG